MTGKDVNNPNSKNEICGMNGDLYIQCENNNNYNTIFNYGNGSKVGIGVLPTEDFHVGVNAKFDSDIFTDRIYTNRITSTDTVIHFGDSSISFVNWNKITWSNMTMTLPNFYGFPSLNIPIQGMAIGRGNTLATGNNSIAIGTNVQTAGGNSIVLGSGASQLSILKNNTTNSLMIGFNSDLPTLFVSPSSGVGTTGSVGICTTYVNSAYKLAVNGSILATEVDVRLGADWPDYVFNDCYSLMELKEVKKYYETNNRLPGFPSAEELVEKGTFSVGKIVTLQQEKIEELTIYITQQEEKIEELYRKYEEILKALEVMAKNQTDGTQEKP